jgi:hypothetical protein
MALLSADAGLFQRSPGLAQHGISPPFRELPGDVLLLLDAMAK